MRTENRKTINIHHELADIKITPHKLTDKNKLKQLIFLALNSYSEDNNVSALKIHEETKVRYGDQYQTVGYYLKLYRTRADLTQKELAKLIGINQHHISEMENNKRTIGKKLAIKLGKALGFDYHKLL